MQKREKLKRVPMPYGKVLVVDDMKTNLDVATLLLEPYQLQIDTASSGFEAIEKVRSGKGYDLIFMDHMMPDMDGIEALKELRKLGFEMPVVALTANFFPGQEEMFLSNGFAVFLKKPIDLYMLDDILNQYIQDGHALQEEATDDVESNQAGNAGSSISGISDEEGQDFNEIAFSHNQALVSTFLKDVGKSIPSLEETIKKQGNYSEQEIEVYTIVTHGLKAPLATMGESELSAFALKLEQAGRRKDIEVIHHETPKFLEQLRAVQERFLLQKTEAEEGLEEGDSVELKEKLLVIKDACDFFDKKTAKNALQELRQKSWPQEVQEQLEHISDGLLDGDFDLVMKIVDSLLV